MESIEKIKVFIEKEKEGQYFEVPFEVAEQICRIDVRYSYPRHEQITDDEGNIYTEERNIVDLALIDGSGTHLGSSGSDRDHIFISESYSSPGYAEAETKAGQWAIVVGAYKIQEQGLTVEYELTFRHKERKLYKGDLHIHTMGSDGRFTLDQIVDTAVVNGLNYLYITDHNNYSHNENIVPRENITVMPGVEWTHYKGHVNFLGVKKAYNGSFYTNSLEEMQEKLKQARENGAIVNINHPFRSDCGFKFGLENAEYDCIEIWNGMLKQADIDCIRWWHSMLSRGRKIAVVGGSDFHENKIDRGIGFPTTNVYAMSAGSSDIGKAIVLGHSFVTSTPKGPAVWMEAEGKIMGEMLVHKEPVLCRITIQKIIKGDLLKIITDEDVEEIVLDQAYSVYHHSKEIRNQKFVRVELYRQPPAPWPLALAMLSNPIYFCAEVSSN